ncbi:MAG: metallophosphoesterase [Actinomycetota bacterium]|nr:metallophosphoesterase [Actinomycetota bacterium]
MASVDRRFEPFVHLVDATDTSVLVAWGGFFLERCDGTWEVVDDDDLQGHRQGGNGTIGALSSPYGAGVVEVLGGGGEVVASATSSEENHVWVEGLDPDTEYRYRVRVDGEAWAGGELWDWEIDLGGPTPSDRTYDLRFRTHPAPGATVPVTFLAFGDYGVGIATGESGRRQQAVARTLEALSKVHPVRFLVSLGDNIYHRGDDAETQSGDEDDDWYLTFYEPYRYLLDHLPLYPAAGNHDGADTEASDDREQLADNFHLDARFRARVAAGRAALETGLFYALRIGGLLEIVCIDTSWADEGGGHDFEHERSQRWLADALPAGGGAGPLPVWRIPFCHHPAYCAGPHHENMPAQIDHVVPLFRQAGVRLVLSGHEHNFQHGRVDGVDYVISGAAGKLQEDPPTRWADGGTIGWAAEPHCLLVSVEEDRITVTPYGVAGPDGEPEPLRVRAPDGGDVPAEIVLLR